MQKNTARMVVLLLLVIGTGCQALRPKPDKFDALTQPISYRIDPLEEEASPPSRFRRVTKSVANATKKSALLIAYPAVILLLYCFDDDEEDSHPARQSANHNFNQWLEAREEWRSE